MAYRSSASASGAPGGTSVVVNAPAGVASGDLLVAAISTGDTVTPPSGWTQQAFKNPGTTQYFYVFARSAGASEPATYTFTLATSQSYAVTIAAWSGVDAVNVEGDDGGFATSTSSGVCPAVTTTTNGCWLIRCGADSSGPSAGVVPTTFPTGTTKRVELNFAGVHGTRGAWIGDDNASVATGATAGRTITFANAQNDGLSVTLALAPANRVSAVTASGGGAPAAVGQKTARAAVAASGAGGASAAGRKAVTAAVTASGGGAPSVKATKATGGVAQAHGAGSASCSTVRGAARAIAASGAGTTATQGRKASSTTVAVVGPAVPFTGQIGTFHAQPSLIMPTVVEALPRDGGRAVATGAKTATGLVAASGAGSASVSARKAVAVTVWVSGAGSCLVQSARPRSAVLAVSGGGTTAATGVKRSSGVAASSAGGQSAVQARKTALSPLGVSGGGSTTATGRKTALRTFSVSGAGFPVAAGRKATFVLIRVSGGAGATAQGEQPHHAAIRVSGGGQPSVLARKSTSIAVTATAAASATAKGSRTSTGQARYTAGGSTTSRGFKGALTTVRATGSGSVTITTPSLTAVPTGIPSAGVIAVGGLGRVALSSTGLTGTP